MDIMAEATKKLRMTLKEARKRKREEPSKRLNKS